MLAEHRELGLASEPSLLAEARRMEPALNPAVTRRLHLPEEETVDPASADGLRCSRLRQTGEWKSAPGCAVTSLIGKEIAAQAWSRAMAKIFRRSTSLSRPAAFQAKLRGSSEARMPRDSHAARPRANAGAAAGHVALQHVLRSERGYLVPRSDGRIVAGSTLEEAGFDKCVTAGGMRKIIEAAARTVRRIWREAEVLETWSGLRPGTPDDLPILGLTETWRVDPCYRPLSQRNPAGASHREARSGLGHRRTNNSFDTEAFSPAPFRIRRT